jgi:hypothetical protein
MLRMENAGRTRRGARMRTLSYAAIRRGRRSERARERERKRERKRERERERERDTQHPARTE